MNNIEYWQRFQAAPRIVAPQQADLVGHDFFCGFGGFSLAAHWVTGAKLTVINAVNHNPLCIGVHQRNNPHTEHHCADMLNPRQFEPGYLPPADFGLFSPECKYHSGATGNRALNDYAEAGQQLSLFEDDDATLLERNQRWAAMSEAERAKALWQAERSRLTMGQVVRMAAHHKYRFFIVENVVEVHLWRHFNQWLAELMALGYEVVPLCLNSMFFGAPQSRDRVFFFCYQKELPKPDLDWHPLAYCPTCSKDVNGVQRFKKPHQQYGKYKSQYLYYCPSCMSQAYPYVRGASSIIDWSLPLHTVGERNSPLFCKQYNVKPLRPKTRARIGAGLRSMQPMSQLDVSYSHADATGKVRSAQQPLFTQTSRQTTAIAQIPGRFVSTLRSGRPRNQSLELPLAAFTSINNAALVSPPQPFVATFRGSRGQQSSAQQPISNVTSVNHHAVVAPQIYSYYSRLQVCTSARQPIPSIMPEPRHALITPPHLLTYHGQSGWHPIGLPTTTQTTKERHALVLPDGQELDLDDPDQLEMAVDACGFRMLSWQEARIGMAFPENYQLTANKRNNFFGLGQAITPCVVPWMIERAIEAWR